MSRSSRACFKARACLTGQRSLDLRATAVQKPSGAFFFATGFEFEQIRPENRGGVMRTWVGDMPRWATGRFKGKARRSEL